MRTIYGDHENSRIPISSASRMYRRFMPAKTRTVITDNGTHRRCLTFCHRIGTAEVESALVSNPRVAEAAVVGIHHAIKGQGIYAFVTLKRGEKPGKATEKELRDHVRKVIGPIASPDKIQFAEGLPKTRSGKIMRRILVKIANGDISNLGDITTLADPSVVETLVNESINFR